MSNILHLPLSGEEINTDELSIVTPIEKLKELSLESSIIIIGANGTGKTRLGTWLDLQSPLREKSLRISAQKSLTMPTSVNYKGIDEALPNFLYGHQDVHQDAKLSYKIHSKWNNKKAATHFLNDFEKLMIYLFSEAADTNAIYVHQSRESVQRIEPPPTKISTLKEVWESLLPHRELIIGGAQVKTKLKGDISQNNAYSSSEMSDGERVVFYLIGACLSAPENGLIIIDEPEIHLHKSLQYPLWQTLEKLRNDCLFAYITHDIDFATSQPEATKIWLKNYDGKSWEWEKIDKNNDLPEDLLLEVMGSRRKVIFVEGDNGSYDLSLYRVLFPEHLVVPRGGCLKVINDVKALKKIPSLHHLEIIGIIDRDRRVDEEIFSLQEDSIYVLSVAEIENLFCTEEIISICCEWLSRDFSKDIKKIKEKIFNSFIDEIDNQISMKVVSEVKFKLNLVSEKCKGRDEIKRNLNSLIDGIDIDHIYSECELLFNDIVSNKKFSELLKFYNRKNLNNHVSNVLEIRNIPYFIIRKAMFDDNKNKIKEALSDYFNHIPGYL